MTVLFPNKKVLFTFSSFCCGVVLNPPLYGLKVIQFKYTNSESTNNMFNMFNCRM